MRKEWKRVSGSLMMAGLMAAMVTGCAGNANGGEGGEDKTAESGSDKIKVTAGVSSDNMPYSYMDENEEMQGYEYAILKECGERLSDKYDFQINMDEWGNLLVGIDTGNYDVSAGSFGYTDERAEKYLYSTEPSLKDSAFHILYMDDRTDISDLGSLAGMTIASTPGLLAESIVLRWNEENPDKEILLEYPDGYEAIYAGMQNGLYDGYIGSTIELTQFAQRFENLKIGEAEIEGVTSDSCVYFIFGKENEELQKDVDACIAEMRADGTLGELCTQWVGGDFTKVD